MLNHKTWHQITKHGLPEFEVVRPMIWSDVPLEPGAAMPPCDKYKLQHLYEQNAIKVREVVAGVEVEPPAEPEVEPEIETEEAEAESDPEVEPEPGAEVESRPKPTKKPKKGR